MTQSRISGKLGHEVASCLGLNRTELRFDLIGEGSQATCYKVSYNADHVVDDGLILKVFRANDLASHLLTHEFKVLRNFFEISRGVPDFGCPEPRAIFCHERSYLMGRVHGEQLSGLLDHGKLNAPAVREIQHILLKALQAFYEAVGECYGDFHPDNVFVRCCDRGIAVTLIDPGMANPSLYYAPPDWPTEMTLSIDLGYWAFVEHARHWRALIIRPRQAMRRILFSRGLIAEAVIADGCDDLRGSIGEIVRWHARRFRDEPSRRLTLVGEFAERLAIRTCDLL